MQGQRLHPRTYNKKKSRIEHFVLPEVGLRPVFQVKAPGVLAMLRRIEARGIHETAHRVRSDCSGIFRYTIATGRTDSDPTQALRGALAPVVVCDRPAIIEPVRIGELLRAIDGCRAHLPTEFALRRLPMVFVRPGELRLAEWVEFDIPNAQCRIPPGRMKMRDQHLVPLAPQVLALRDNK